MSEQSSSGLVPTVDAPYGLGVLTGTAYRGLFGHFGAFFTIALLPWLLTLAVNLGVTYVILTHSRTPSEAMPWQFLQLLAGGVIGIYFGVAWHRYMLGVSPARFASSLGKRHVTFFLYSLLLAVPLGIGAFLGGAIGGAVLGSGAEPELLTLCVLLGVLIGGYPTLRLSLCLPAAAAEVASIGPSRSWRVMRGRVLAMFGASVLALGPMVLGIYFFSQLIVPVMIDYVMTGRGLGLVVGFMAVNGLLSMMLAALSIGVLSQALRSLIPDPRKLD